MQAQRPKGDPQALERTANGRRSAHRFALIVVLNEKLLDVMGDDVTQDQAFAHANDVLKNVVGGHIYNTGDIIHIPGTGQKSTLKT